MQKHVMFAAAVKHTGANSGLKVHRPAAPTPEPQTQDETTTQVPKTRTAGPFSTHTALTPAQRGYLRTIAASYSSTRVRHLITQHYINVLRRCKPAVFLGYSPDRKDVAVTSHESEKGKDPSTSLPQVSSRAKHKGRKNTNTRRPEKSFLPNIPNGQKRFSNTSPSKQIKRKKRKTSSPKVKTRFRNRLLKEEDEEGQTNSLSQCLSSLSVGEHDDRSFSDS
ncbi:hypothetical protein Q5P01_020972 [Channa striata]|uniref:Protein FAM216A n=1 Tax=Channa striata TaxID=64152 RepID=A0AA88LYH6_CHASR|nr:hypothetical protein Q5P01_020972 [Channa striata]